MDQILSERADGSAAALQSALILPRQNGKNSILEALELTAFFLLDEQRILHTAHLAESAADHMTRMVGLIRENPDLDRVVRVYVANGKEKLIRTDTGATIQFKTRSRKSGRGPSPQRVIFDEALHLTDEQVQATLPSMSAHSLDLDGMPQMIYTSSAPLFDSVVLHRVRDHAMSGKAESMFYAEWSAELGTAVDDVDAWYAANPALGIRISEDWIRGQELAMMSEEAFSVERLGVVYPPSSLLRDPIIPAESWIGTGTDSPPDLEPGDITLAFDVTRSGWSSIVIASGSISAPYVDLVEHRDGAGWVPGRLAELAVKWKPTAIGCNGAGPAGAQVGPVMAALAAVGVDANLFRQLTTLEYKQACGGILSDIVEGRLSRPTGQGPLDLAAADAIDRPLGDAWAWDLRQSSVPISPLVAATVARALLPVVATKPRRVFAY